MTKIIRLLFLLLIIINKSLFSQEKSNCFYINEVDNLAYHIDDSTKLFSGEFINQHKNGRTSSQQIIKNGRIISGVSYNKKGTLIDSLVLINSEEYIHDFKKYSKNGQLILHMLIKNLDKPIYTKQFYKNGNVWSIEHFENGKKNGLFQLFYKNGNIRSEIKYQNGTIINPGYFWEKNGDKYEVINRINASKAENSNFEAIYEVSRKKID
jgi:antitoxin component YwqK of YwqJK toxin-antitoxin module